MVIYELYYPDDLVCVHMQQEEVVHVPCVQLCRLLLALALEAEYSNVLCSSIYRLVMKVGHHLVTRY